MVGKRTAGKRIGRTILVAAMCLSLGGTAEARPRLLRMLGILAAPMGAIAGGIHARAHHSRHRPRTEVATPQKEELAKRATPVFWSTAFDDLFAYTLADPQAEARFWAHDYGDVLDAMFVAPRTNVSARTRRVAMRDAGNVDDPAQNMATAQNKCGGDDPGAVDRVIQHLRSETQPTPEQATALDNLQKALTTAYDRIKSACPASPGTIAGARLDVMAARLLAMRQAAIIVLTPLRQFYATLSDTQKARLEGTDSENSAATIRAARETKGCAATPADRWPVEKITRRLAPRPDQAKDLQVLQGTSAYLSDFVGKSCVTDRPETPPDRLEAALKRINVMRYAVTHVSPAFDEFYGSLSPTQRSRLATLGR
jgi:hypothetical protein